MSSLNVVYSCDEAYVPHTGISMLSLFANNKGFEYITVYFIHKSVTEHSLGLLKELAKEYDRALVIIPIGEIISRLKIKSTGRHIETIYVKLFLGQLTDLNKVLYIDSDTIVNSSLAELWERDVSKILVAGVDTTSVDSKPLLSLTKSDQFINDGVVLLNLDLIRKHKIEDKFVSAIAQYEGEPPVLSEGIINTVCKGRILSLHPKYNLLSGLIGYKFDRFSFMDSYYSKSLIAEAIEDPVIIHYLSAFFNRPWTIRCTHPLRNRYLYYKSLSSWRDLPLIDQKLGLRLRVIKFLYRVLPATPLNFVRYLFRNAGSPKSNG